MSIPVVTGRRRASDGARLRCRPGDGVPRGPGDGLQRGPGDGLQRGPGDGAGSQRPARAAGSLLRSKITIPRPPGWAVRRERIGRLIEAGASGPLTVVTGAPGAGKTMALASWAAGRRQRPTAWVTLDRFDNRPEILWCYICEALSRCGVAIPARPGPAGPDHAFLQQLASVLAAQDPPVTLVLDDVHLLTERGPLDGLAYVVGNASAGLRVLIASRMDPLLPLHRYRLTGELTEIRAADLAFRVPEAETLIAQHRVALSPASLETLVAKTEGWAAGLRLAAMSLEKHPDPERSAAEFGAGQSAVTGYFVNEVLNAQPPGVRDVLLRTSILDQVSPMLAGELAGGATAWAVISRLARENTFVQPLGGDWYRYHPLFAEVLSLKLRHEFPLEVKQLHQRAAGWLRRNGMLAEAVSQLAAAGEWRLAARMTVEDLAVDRLADPRAGNALAAAFRQLPAAAEDADPPTLIIGAAMRLRALDDQAGAAWLLRAERALAPLPAADELPSRLAVPLMRAEMARRSGDLGAVKAAVAGTASLAGRLPAAALSQRAGLLAQLLFLRGAAEMWAGQLDEAAPILEEATARLEGTHRWADSTGYWALLEALRGRLGLAAGLAAPATVPAPGEPSGAGPASLASVAADTALALVHLEHGRLGEASGRLSRAEDGLRARPDRLISTVAGLVAARGELAAGRAAAAARTVHDVRRQWPPPPWLDRRLALTGSRAHAVAAVTGELLPATGQFRLSLAHHRAAAVPAAVIVEQLSSREREVLRHVSGMLSTAEVADEMYISVNTVKSHLKSIFRKLGATRRGEAVRRARELRLI